MDGVVQKVQHHDDLIKAHVMRENVDQVTMPQYSTYDNW